MTDLNRRNFLFGTVATAAAAAGLVLKAPQDAVKLFEPTLNETLSITRIPNGPSPLENEWFHATVYDKHGNAVVDVPLRDWSIESQIDAMTIVRMEGYFLDPIHRTVDVTSFRDTNRRIRRL